MAIDRREIGRRIKRGISQQGLAEQLSVTRQAVSLVEKGGMTPSLNLLDQIRQSLSLTWGDLLD